MRLLASVDRIKFGNFPAHDWEILQIEKLVFDGQVRSIKTTRIETEEKRSVTFNVSRLSSGFKIGDLLYINFKEGVVQFLDTETLRPQLFYAPIDHNVSANNVNSKLLAIKRPRSLVIRRPVAASKEKDTSNMGPPRKSVAQDELVSKLVNLGRVTYRKKQSAKE